MMLQALRRPVVFALLQLVLAAGQLRRLSYEPIRGYTPGTDVTQHNILDKDQKEMEDKLKETPPNWAAAKAIYEGGVNSGAYARMTVGALAAAATKSSAVVQANNAAATGSMKKDKAAGETSIDVSYTSICRDNTHASNHDVSGCYTTGGALTVSGTDIGAPSAVTNKYRTLAGFSTAAGSKMQGQPFFEKFEAYYGNADYGHRYVTAALDGSGIFTGKDDVSRVEGTKKGSAYMNVWMYVVREMEDAIDDCEAACPTCNDDSVHAWDEAVAFYTGSLENGLTGGKMLYTLADKRCKNFKTCGSSGALTNTGLSNVNKRIFVEFEEGKGLLQANNCADVYAIKDKIVNLMTVPLVQGALRYAYKVDKESGGSKEKAEGAVFSAAVLPLIHACSATAATLISKNMNIDSLTPMVDGFQKVREAFESTYTCLGITCADVGGLIVSSTMYKDGAAPCGTGTTEGSANSAIEPLVSSIVQLVVASGFFLAIWGDK